MNKPVIICVLTLVFICGCALKPVDFNRYDNMENYKYAFVINTEVIHSAAGSEYGFVSKSVKPRDIIAGILIKKGIIIVPEISYPSQTLIAQYGQSGRRNIWGGLLGYTLEVSIQILNAKTHDIVYNCTAEGMGSTEVDDIREAITRCLENL